MRPCSGALARLLLLVVLAGSTEFGAAPADAAEPGTTTATFAGGCFWCMQSPFEELPGVLSTTVGYTGGETENPSYEQVSAGDTGHAEAVRIVYDPSRIRYEQLLQVFWHNVDPVTPDAQFCDHGDQYRAAIFTRDEAQRRLAEESKQRLEASGRFDRPIVTEIVAAREFYPAEDTHQNYHQKNPARYKLYRWNCGRDERLKTLWGDAQPMTFKKPSDAGLRRSLTTLQYQVTQQEATEPPFDNEFWDNHRAGIYVDVVSGEPLFSSLDKYDSGTGWPSFTRPLEPGHIREKVDRRLLVSRTEIRSAQADSHVGHVFDDGPPPAGRRYCMNSAALRFVPVERLREEGFARYLPLFENAGSSVPARAK